VERGRRLAIGAVGIAVMLLTAALVVRAAGGGGGGDVGLEATPSSIDALSGDLDPLDAAGGIEPGTAVEATTPTVFFYDPAVPPGLDPLATLPPPGVATIPLPDFSGVTMPGGSGAPSPAGPAAFTEAGVWVVKADGSSPTLVARNATAGVAAGGTWVAFLEGRDLRAVRRSALGTKSHLAGGVTGTAAQGLPVSGGKRGVAFVLGGRVVLVDPAAPGSPLASYEAPGADAVAAEEDGDGRLAWADSQGLHVGTPGSVAAGDDVQRGMLALGHGFLASLQDGRVTIRNGPRLDWGEVDRLQTGGAGMVAASGGRVHLRTRAGEDRAMLEGASTPVITATRILYVSSRSSLASASLTGTGATVVGRTTGGRSITNLDLLDDDTLVVTVA
jgi:hypothetical protein